MITGRRHETLTLHTIMQGMSTSECEWVLPPNNLKRTHDHQSEAEMKKRRELLQEFLFWYFDGFVMQLLKVSVSSSVIYEEKKVLIRGDDILHHGFFGVP